MNTINTIVHGDGLDLLRSLPFESVDMIFADLPYGLTECTWDVPIDLKEFWAAAVHAAKPEAAIILSAQQPFTSLVVLSNHSMYRSEWIWTDGRPSNPYTAKLRPLQVHESILVFGKKPVKYYPQMYQSGIRKSSRGGGGFAINQGRTPRVPYSSDGERYPTTILDIPMPYAERGRHPTQKPLQLLSYLIETYTVPGDLVVDPCIGSGVSMVAANRAKRRYIGADIESRYVTEARAWLRESFNLKFDWNIDDHESLGGG